MNREQEKLVVELVKIEAQLKKEMLAHPLNTQMDFLLTEIAKNRLSVRRLSEELSALVDICREVFELEKD